MSNISSATIQGAIANSLANPSTPTEEALLFQEAFENARREKQQAGPIPAFFTDLKNAKTIEDVRQALDRERGTNVIWRDQHGRKWRKSMTRLAGVILSYKPLVDALVQTNSKIAAPIWGGLAFILGVVKDMSITDELLNQAQSRLESSMERFQSYYRPNEPTQHSLRSSLVHYYQRIITFVVDLQAQFAHGWAVSLAKTVHRSVKEVVESFNKDVKDLIENVDWGSLARHQNETRDQLAELRRAMGSIQSQPPPLNASAVQPTASTRSFTHGVPTMLSNKFMGQTGYLQQIRQSLTRDPQGQCRTAICGLGGIGKTQILLKYVKMHSVDTGTSRAYTSVVWFNDVTTADMLRVITSLLSVVRPSMLPGQQDQVLIVEFHKWLREQQGWLLIFDNVEQFDAIRDVLPPAGDVGHIIFATRHKLLASHLTSSTEPIEISPMDDQTAKAMVLSLAQESSLAEDRTPDIANRVAQFAKGLPLVIEQVVHNALLCPRSIEETLRLVEGKADLLEQENISSLRGPNSSIRAIVMQSMADLELRDAEAGALFKIMVYWTSSSIPLNMIHNGAGKLRTYVDRPFTFDRGQITRTRDQDVDRIDLPCKPAKFRLFDEEPFRMDTWLRFLHLKEHQSRYTNTDLPFDETRFDAALRVACSENSPIGRLFKNEDTILHAVKIVAGTGLVRKSGIDTVWIHDLFSEVARAIIERGDRQDHSALTATTLVYLAFPVPTKLALRERELLCSQYLPHALACHHHFKTQGILNDFSLGPELSHIIASTFCMRLQPSNTSSSTNLTEDLLKSTRSMAERRNNEAIRFYRDALAGYLASRKRIESVGGVTPERILFSAVADQSRERQQGYQYTDYTYDLQRFGRNAHWRVVQTALQLSGLLQDGSYEELEQAIQLTTLALGIQELLFGIDHDDTIQTRQKLHCQLFQAGRTEEAYDVALLGLKHLLGWSQTKQIYCGGKEEHKSFSSSAPAAIFCSDVGICCLQIPGKDKEAVVYFKVFLKYCEQAFGEELHLCVKPMQRLATAFEKCGEKLASIYWFGRSVLCALRVLELEWLTYEENEEGRYMWNSALLRSETFLQETVGLYEEVRERFGVFEELSLCQFLGAVDARIKLWRLDREKNGSPYAEVRSKDLAPVFPAGESAEEFEARIQKDAEAWVKAQQLEEHAIVEADVVQSR